MFHFLREAPSAFRKGKKVEGKSPTPVIFASVTNFEIRALRCWSRPRSWQWQRRLAMSVIRCRLGTMTGRGGGCHLDFHLGSSSFGGCSRVTEPSDRSPKSGSISDMTPLKISRAASGKRLPSTEASNIASWNEIVIDVHFTFLLTAGSILPNVSRGASSKSGLSLTCSSCLRLVVLHSGLQGALHHLQRLFQSQ